MSASRADAIPPFPSLLPLARVAILSQSFLSSQSAVFQYLFGAWKKMFRDLKKEKPSMDRLFLDPEMFFSGLRGSSCFRGACLFFRPFFFSFNKV